jgi:uncharacterized protein (TIGR03067 family)
MKKFILVALAAGLLVGADDPKKGDGKKGAKGLEGTWTIVSFTQNGKDNDELKDTQVVFKGKNVTVKTKDGDQKGTFQIDPKKKTIDLTPTEGGQKGKTMKGIYQLKGDDLKVCHSRVGKDRPKDFTAGEGSGNALIVLKRAKAK